MAIVTRAASPSSAADPRASRRSRRIACIVAGLGPGGAERVLSTLAGEWAGRGHAVSLVTIADQSSDFFPLPASVDRIGIGMAAASPSWVRAIGANARRLGAIRRTVRAIEPDVVVAFGDQTNVLAILATRRLGVPLVISERSMPGVHRIGALWNALRRAAYPRADRLVVQTEVARAWAARVVSSDRIRVIPNPLGREYLSVSKPLPARENRVIAIGRLGPEKGYDMLLEAFTRVAPQFPDWSLTFFGDGPLREPLEALARSRLGPTRIRFHGITRRPDQELLRSAVFALSSRYEGFPNALLEAMACGCAVVAATCDAGPAEIVADGRTGMLVEPNSIDALAAALARVLGDAALRDRLGRAASLEALGYAPSRIADRWEAVFAEVCR